jgi:ubiquinone/menaquinone biosynthesis C-methylase UbiE
VTISITTPDFTAIKGRQRVTWGSGDYHRVAAIIVPISERLCDTVDLRAGQSVLDVATGSGNTAIAAARRMCHVTGVDYVGSLLNQARTRAAAENLDVRFEEGDAEALPAADGAFDVVLSTVGVMFAPNQEQAASELLRVCRPGGRIGLASWTPEGWIGEMLKIVGRHVPPPAGLRPPSRWGTEEGVRDLLGDGVSSLHMTREKFVWRFTSPEQYLHLFRTYYGPTYKAFETLDEAGQQALTDDLIAALLRHARVTDGTLQVPAEYLEVVAVRAH